MKNGKQHLRNGLQLQDKIRALGEKEIYKDLGILKADTIKQEEMKEEKRKNISEEPESYSRQNYIAETWAVLLVRYSGPFLKWTREEPKQMNQRTRKLMTMHEILHPRDDVGRLFVSGKKGGRGFASIEDSVDASIQQLQDNIQKCGGRLITITENNINNTRTNRMTRARENSEKNKSMDVLSD